MNKKKSLRRWRSRERTRSRECYAIGVKGAYQCIPVPYFNSDDIKGIRLISLILSQLYKVDRLWGLILCYCSHNVQSSPSQFTTVFVYVLFFGPRYALSHIILRPRMNTCPANLSSFPHYATLFFHIPVSFLFSFSAILNFQSSVFPWSGQVLRDYLWLINLMHILSSQPKPRGKKLSTTVSFGLRWKGYNYLGLTGTLKAVNLIFKKKSSLLRSWVTSTLILNQVVAIVFKISILNLYLTIYELQRSHLPNGDWGFMLEPTSKGRGEDQMKQCMRKCLLKRKAL